MNGWMPKWTNLYSFQFFSKTNRCTKGRISLNTFAQFEVNCVFFELVTMSKNRKITISNVEIFFQSAIEKEMYRKRMY